MLLTYTDKELTVSIHAPTRGATEADRPIIIPYVVSIHAPTRGATPDLAIL